MLSDNILTTFYIEQFDLVSCCGRWFCKIMFHTLGQGNKFVGKKCKWQVVLRKISDFLCPSGNKLIYCGIYFCELKNVSKFSELNFSNLTYELIG